MFPCDRRVRKWLPCSICIQPCGDYRTAVACIREHCRILELIGKLGGELDEKTQTNIPDVTLDSGTGNRSWENPRHQAASRLCVDAQPLWHFLSRTAHGLSHRPWARRGDYSETHAQGARRGFCRCMTIAEAAVTLEIVVIFISRPFGNECDFHRWRWFLNGAGYQAVSLCNPVAQ